MRVGAAGAFATGATPALPPADDEVGIAAGFAIVGAAAGLELAAPAARSTEPTRGRAASPVSAEQPAPTIASTEQTRRSVIARIAVPPSAHAHSSRGMSAY